MTKRWRNDNDSNVTRRRCDDNDDDGMTTRWRRDVIIDNNHNNKKEEKETGRMWRDQNEEKELMIMIKVMMVMMTMMIMVATKKAETKNSSTLTTEVCFLSLCNRGYPQNTITPATQLLWIASTTSSQGRLYTVSVCLICCSSFSSILYLHLPCRPVIFCSSQFLCSWPTLVW